LVKVQTDFGCAGAAIWNGERLGTLPIQLEQQVLWEVAREGMTDDATALVREVVKIAKTSARKTWVP
jgi:hypothetical protein